jgi:hypothetical protein
MVLTMMDGSPMIGDNGDVILRPAVDIDYLFSVLGLVFIIEGLPYFAFPSHLKRWLRQLLASPDSVLRGFGFAAMVLGLLLIYLGRRRAL